MAFTNWDGNIVDIGPIYPWVGLEAVMVIAAFVFWIGWHVVQLRQENRRFEDEARALRKSGDLQRLMQADDFD
jgi:hypothetical protein